MFNLSQIVKSAWVMIKAGVSKSEAFKKAWAIAKAPKIVNPLTILENSPLVKSLNLWTSGKIMRTYVNLFGYKHCHRGDRNFKLYFCHNTNKMVVEAGKGFTSSEFEAAVKQLKAQF